MNPKSETTTPPTDGTQNQGEGDREAARRYNEDAQAFVASGKVDAAARNAQDQDPAEAKAAEAAGKARAKELDPEEKRDYANPSRP